MKLSLFRSFVALALITGAHGAGYTTNFNFASAGADIHNKDGWTISDTTDQYSQIAVANVNPTAPTSFSNVLNLGDASAVTTPPPGSSVTLTHDYEGTVGATNITFDFVMFDSFTGPFASRDQFGFSISDGGSNLFSVSFVPDPDVASLDPSTDEARWELYYRIGAGPSVALNIAVLELAQYRLNLDFTPNVNPLLTDFMLSVTSAVPNTLSDGATGIALNPSAATGEFNISWSKDTGNPAFGSNSILLDNLSVVPEPSSSLLICLAGLGFVSRRKRA